MMTENRLVSSKALGMQKKPQFYLVKLWFALDAVLALAPPLYWLADAHRAAQVFSLPVTLLYFLLVSVFITASILYAYWAEVRGGEFTSC